MNTAAEVLRKIKSDLEETAATPSTDDYAKGWHDCVKYASRLITTGTSEIEGDGQVKDELSPSTREELRSIQESLLSLARAHRSVIPPTEVTAAGASSMAAQIQGILGEKP